MAKYSDENILESQAKIRCFASATVLAPEDIHGGKLQPLPMSEISAFAAAMGEREPKLPLLFAAKIIEARERYRMTRVLPFVAIELRDGSLLSSFFIRRHRADNISDFLIAQSVISLFSFISRQAMGGNPLETAIERPSDANKEFDIAVSLLPDLVTIHKEVVNETEAKL